MMTLSYWRNRAFDIVGALVLAVAILQLYGWWQVHQREGDLPSTWMEVIRLDVPDTVVGGDPDVVFERQMKRDMVGDWYAELFHAGGAQVCAGRGSAAFTVEEPTELHFALSRFLNTAGCLDAPGSYILQATFRLTDEMGARKVIRRQSNPFFVAPAGSIAIP